MGFSFKITETNNCRKIALKGNLIEKNQATDLLHEIDFLLGNGVLNFILDLNDLEYMNSSGLSVLINILTLTRNKGGEVVISNVSDKINALLIMTKLNTVFQVTDSNKEALEYFHSAQETLDQ